MFDGIMNTVKGFAMNIVWFAVAGFVGSALWQIYPGGEGFDIMWSVKIAVTGGVAALTTSLFMGAAKG